MRTLKIIVPLFVAFGLHACGELVAGDSAPMAYAQTFAPGAYSQTALAR